MNDIEQFEDVVSHIRSNLTEMTLNRPAPTTPVDPRPARTSHGWRWALAWAVLVAVAIVPVSRLLSDAVDTVAEVTTPTTSDDVGEESDDTHGIDWEAIDTPPGFNPLPGVSTVGGRWIAPAPDQIGQLSPVTGYWTSIDGRTWTFTEIDPALFGMTAAYLRDFAEFGGRLYAIAKGEPVEAGTVDEVVVASSDGVTWEPIADPAMPRTPLTLASGSGGVLIVSRGTGGLPSWQVTITVDGTSWSTATVNLDGITSPIGAVTDDGFYIGGVELLDADAVMWVSEDGAVWQPVIFDGSPRGAAAPIPTAAGLVVRVSSANNGSTRLFRLEPAGPRFVDVTPEGFPRTTVIMAVTGRGLVVVSDLRTDERVLWSHDLATWHRASLPPTIDGWQTSELAALGDTVIIKTFWIDPGADQATESWFRGVMDETELDSGTP